MIIAHIVTGMQIGGLERVVVNLVRGLTEQEYRQIVVCLEQGGPFAAEVEQLGVEVIVLGKQAGMSWRAVRQISGILGDKQVQVVHSHNPAPHFHAVLAALLARVPVRVHTKHGRNYPDNPKKVMLNRVLSWFTDAIVPVGDAAGKVATTIEKVNPRKVRRIWNGIDVEQYSPNAQPSTFNVQRANCPPSTVACPLVIGTVARLSPEKDQKTMLQAFKLVLDRWSHAALPACSETAATERRDYSCGPQAADAVATANQSMVSGLRSPVSNQPPRLVVIGDGPCRGELEGEATRLGITRDVDFLGARSDVAALLPHFSVFTLSSETEGISMTILEAMACEVPIVATDVGGNREIVQPPACGLIVPAGNPEALANAYLELLRDPAQRAQMGQAGRQRVVEHFSLDAMCRQYAALYQELLKKRGKRGHSHHG